MAVFRNLKNHGQKIIKFKQGKVLDNELAFWENVNASLTGDGAFNYGKGVCAAISLRFIGELLGNRLLMDLDDFSFNRDEGVSSKNTHNEGLYNEAVRFQSAYVKRFETVGNRDAVAEMANRMGLEVAVMGRDLMSFDSSLVDFATYWSGKVTDSVAAYLSYNFKTAANEPGSHAIAIGRRFGKIYIFDSNIGGYHVVPANVEAFMTTYVQAYAAYWTIGADGLFALPLKKTA